MSIDSLDDFVQALENSGRAIVDKVQEPQQANNWTKFTGLVKDFGPVFTGTASIIASLLAITLTGVVAYFTYQFNQKQAAALQTSLRTTALTDFTQAEEGPRTLAAIRLAAYGTDALPAIRMALGVTHEGIRAGGVQTAEVLYRSRPEVRQDLLVEMIRDFDDQNPTLRLGVLEFYIKAAPQLSAQEKRAFLAPLGGRLGSHASLCSNENSDFVLKSATFLTKGSFPEAKELLLDIARNCPHGNVNYEGARIHAINQLFSVVQQQHLPKNEREAIINQLRGLETDASGEFKDNVETAIGQIQSIQGP